jgi:hypothetical protein
MSNKNTFSCTPAFPLTLFGPYGYSTSIVVFNAIGTLPAHAFVRIRTSYLWIDNWANWNNFTIFIDNLNITYRNYSSGSNFVVASPTCNSTSTGILYSVMDLGEISHTNSSINITYTMGPCNCAINFAQANYPGFVKHVAGLLKIFILDLSFAMNPV